MKKIGFLVMAAAMLCGCGEKRSSGSGPMFRMHWVGAAKVPEGTNAFAKVLGMESSTLLRNEAFTKLARTPQQLWKKSLPEGAADQAASIGPLLEDLWKGESLVELRGSPDRPDLMVATQLTDDRAELWSKSLKQAANGWKLGSEKPFTSGAATGWSASGKGLGVHYVRSGQWVLAAVAHDATNPFEAWLKSERPAPPLSGSVVEVHADWPRLNRAVPLLAKYPLPAMDFKISQRGQALRTEGKFIYSEPLAHKVEPWKIPTNIVMEPIISFTCAQGIAPLLNHIKGFSKLRLKTPPNQICMWAQVNAPVQTFLAVPMADPTNVIKEIAPRLPDVIKAHFTNDPGKFLWVSNRSEWVWTGLPMFIPHLRPEKSATGEFIFAGLFPPGRSNTAPAELFGQVLGRTNLVYYDWELTQERLAQIRHMMQLLDIINKRRLPTTNSVGHRWSREIEPLLGNAITEATLSSPKEVAFVRKSELGLTGFELTMLTRWIESAGFPLRYDPPPPLNLRTNRPAPPRKLTP